MCIKVLFLFLLNMDKLPFVGCGNGPVDDPRGMGIIAGVKSQSRREEMISTAQQKGLL